MSDYDHENSDFEDDTYNSKNDMLKQIDQFTENDYLKCKETRNILIDNFHSKFENDLEDKLKDLFLNYFYNLNGKFSSVLYRAEEEHVNDFIELIKYHISRNYDISIFKDNPELAEPLISQIENIKIKEMKQKQKILNNKMVSSIQNQENFVWKQDSVSDDDSSDESDTDLDSDTE